MKGSNGESWFKYSWVNPSTVILVLFLIICLASGCRKELKGYSVTDQIYSGRTYSEWVDIIFKGSPHQSKMAKIEIADRAVEYINLIDRIYVDDEIEFSERKVFLKDILWLMEIIGISSMPAYYKLLTNGTYRYEVVCSLLRMGKDAIDAVPWLSNNLRKELHSNTNRRDCDIIIEILANMGQCAKEALPVLIEIISSRLQRHLVEKALIAVSRIARDNDDIMEVLLSASKSEDNAISTAAFKALALNGVRNNEISNLIEVNEKSSNVLKRIWSLYFVAKNAIKTNEAVSELDKLLGNRNYYKDALEAITYLSESNDKCRVILLNAQTINDEYLFCLNSYSLDGINLDGLIPILLKNLGRSTKEYIWAALSLLRKIDIGLEYSVIVFDNVMQLFNSTNCFDMEILLVIRNLGKLASNHRSELMNIARDTYDEDIKLMVEKILENMK